MAEDGQPGSDLEKATRTGVRHTGLGTHLSSGSLIVLFLLVLAGADGSPLVIELIDYSWRHVRKDFQFLMDTNTLAGVKTTIGSS